MLFNGPNEEFIVVWRDYRDGHPAYYAQRFDAEAKPKLTNFKILSNEALAFGPNSVFASFGHQFFFEPPIELYQGFLQISGPTGIMMEPAKVTEFWVPPDFVGCPAFGSALAATRAGYVLGDAYNSEFRILGFDSAGQHTFSMPDSLLPGYDAFGFALAALPGGSFAYFWIGAGQDFTGETVALYGYFFDAAQAVLADSVVLATFHGFAPACDAGYTMRAMSLSDSLYQLFYSVEDTLRYLTCNRDGVINQPIRASGSERPSGVPADVRPRTLAPGISNIKAGTFTVLGGVRYYWHDGQNWRTVNQTTKYEFTTAGQLIDAFSQPTSFSEIRNLRRVDVMHSQLPLTIGEDIYLHNLAHLTLLDSTKLNDDQAGANQRHPSVIGGPDETFLVSWFDERGRKSRMIDAKGVPIGDEFSIDFIDGAFFPSGEFLAFWKAESSKVFTLGYRIYSQEWQITHDGVLARRGESQFWMNAKTTLRDDDSFVVLLQDSTDLHLLTLSKTGGVEADRVVAQGQNPTPVKIALDPAGFLWSVWRSDTRWIWNVRAFDLAFHGLSTITEIEHLLAGQIDFVGSGRFAYLRRQSFPKEPGIYLFLEDTLSKEPLAETLIAPNAARSVQLQTLRKNRVHLSWVADRTLWSRSFDRAGVPLRDAIAVYSSGLTKELQGTYAVSGDKVLFVWSDAVIPGNGFDILGKTLDVPFVTRVETDRLLPARFTLHQNYPNPFNPETSIEYEIARPGHVLITIHNVLGQRVRTLVDRVQAAGSYRTVWDGRDEHGKSVASGLYFCSLKAEESTMLSKRLLLLK